jgi:hypothetical protein
MKLFRYLLVLSVLLPVSFLQAGTKTANPSSAFQPTIIGVDKDGITVRTGRNAGVKVKINDVKQMPSNIKKFRVTQSTTITVNGLPGTLEQLKTGMAVQVNAGMDRDVAGAIVANTIAEPLPTPPPGTNAGSGSSIGTRVLEVTSDLITIANPGGKAVAYRIPQDVVVKVNGVFAPLTSVQVGMLVTVDATGQSARRIVAQDAK